MSEAEIKPYKDQIYDELKSKHLKLKKLFVDNEFPPDYRSLAKYKAPPSEVYWKRPNEIVNNPQFFVNGPDPDDIDQGLIGDCWYIAGAIAIAAYPEYLEKVVPKNQSFSKDYCGIFHFRFWKYGQWYDVVIDDLLPVNRNNELIYCRNKRTKNEFWCSLLEKAYAKLATCYEFLDGGFTHDSMIDLTGGINENFDLYKMRLNQTDVNNLWKIINKAHLMKSLIGASIFGNGTESIQYNGLVKGHAYSVLKLLEFTPKNSSHTVRLIRIRNPWQNAVEWNGRFSDYSSEWYYAPDSIKKEIGVIKPDDGEFWMPFDEFLKQFSNLSIVHVDMNGFFNAEYLNRKTFKWHCKTYHGEWKAGLNSGGYSYLFTNPQYLINVKDVDLDDNDDKATLIVSLMQKESIKKRAQNYGRINDEPINFKVFRLVNDSSIKNQYQGSFKFNAHDLQMVGDSGEYSAYQVISKRFKLTPGNYVVIPSTYNYNINLKYLLRLFTEFEIKDNYKTRKNNNSNKINKIESFNKTEKKTIKNKTEKNKNSNKSKKNYGLSQNKSLPKIGKLSLESDSDSGSSSDSDSDSDFDSNSSDSETSDSDSDSNSSSKNSYFDDDKYNNDSRNNCKKDFCDKNLKKNVMYGWKEYFAKA